MARIRPQALSGLAAAALLLLSAAGARAVVEPHAAATPRPETVPLPGLRFDGGVAVGDLRTLAARRGADPGPGWNGRVDPATGAVRMAWGGDRVLAPAVTGGADAERLGRAFLVEQRALLFTDPASTVLEAVRRGRGKSVVRFRQEIGGVPVLGAQAFVLIHDNGRVAAFGSSFLPVHESPDAAVLDASDALGVARGTMRARISAHRAPETDLYLARVPRGEDLVLAPVWSVRFAAEHPFGTWRTFVDAVTGSVVGRWDENRYVDVIGDVSVTAELFGTCGSSFNVPAGAVDVHVLSGNSSVTQSDGSFVVPHAGSLPVIVSAELKGPYVDVNRAAEHGADASFLGAATPGLPLSIPFGPANARADERDAFHLTNEVHGFIKGIDPTLTQLDSPLPVNVGRTDAICPGNAWYDGTSVNFCDSTAVFSNTGRSETIIYHEYGHAVNSAVYGRNGVTLTSAALEEGNADVIANFIRRSPIIAEGYFRGDCGSFLRDSQNQLQWPDDLQGGSGHADGRIIAGFHWDLWQSLLATRPQAVADSVAFHTWHEARDLGVPLDLPEQVLWTFLADDDDGTLSNGTPNFLSICQAALNHGFDCPESVPQVVVSHSRVNHITDGATPVEIRATVESAIDAIDPATIVTEYRVDGGVFQTLPMTATGNTDEYSVFLPPLPAVAEVEYFITARDVQDSVGTSPPNAPVLLHAFDVAWLYDPVETGAGWTAGDPGDDATAGAWGHFDPVGTIAQPENDASVGPGDVFCFVTGQCGTGHGTCWSGCNLGCNDVDGGTTTLTSPVWDLAGASAAVVKYDRWYSNDQAAAPGEDFWVVEISNDGGSTWTGVENTSRSDARWTTQRVDLASHFASPGQVQLRFRASDLANPSLVEAAVDDVRILAQFGGTITQADVTAPPPPFRLAQSRPNPARPGASIEFALPRATAANLSIYDVRGRIVRTLWSGRRPAGRHVVPWDGRDAAGARVAPGVYFYRLSSDAGNLTRKLTVAP